MRAIRRSRVFRARARDVSDTVERLQGDRSQDAEIWIKMKTCPDTCRGTGALSSVSSERERLASTCDGGSVGSTLRWTTAVRGAARSEPR